MRVINKKKNISGVGHLLLVCNVFSILLFCLEISVKTLSVYDPSFSSVKGLLFECRLFVNLPAVHQSVFYDLLFTHCIKISS